MSGAVYARQSVEKQNSLSIEGQIALCQRAAGQALTVYTDRGYSGRNTRRPAFQKLLRDVVAGRIARLYVYRLDRFSRSVADFGRLWEILQAHRVEFVSVNEHFDTSTPMGRAMLHIIMVFAQLERETTAERVRDNYYRRAGMGAWPGGPAPYGYTIGRELDAGGRTVSTLTVQPEQAQVVKRIFTSYASDSATLGSVARELNRAGIHGPRRNTWDTVTLSRILHSPVYVRADEEVRLYYLALGAEVTSPESTFDGVHGLLLVGRRDRAGKGDGDSRTQRLSVLGSPGLISGGLWLACQEKLRRNRQVGNRGKGRHTWLSGLLKCAACGYSLKVVRDGSRRYLHCSGRYNLSKCGASVSLRLEELEAEIGAKIQPLLDSCPLESVQNEDPYTEQLRELDRRADRLVDAFSSREGMCQELLHRALERLEEERSMVLAARKRADRAGTVPERLVFDALPQEGKKAVAALLVRRVEVQDDAAEVFWTV